MAIAYDLVNPVVLTTTVRDAPEPPGIGLNAILPDRLFTSFKAVWDDVTRTNRSAHFRAWDAATKVGKRDNASRKEAEFLPLGEQYLLGERDQLELAAMETGGDASAQVRRIVFDDAVRGANATRIRMEYARGDVLRDGIVSITDDGLDLSYDFDLDADHEHTVAATWATASTDIPTHIGTFMDLWYDDGGGDAVLTVSRTTLRHLLTNEKFRALASINGFTPSTLSLPQLNSIMEGYGWPQIRVYNSSFDFDGATTRVIDAQFALLTPLNPLDLGYTAWGVTAEALTLAQAQMISVDGAAGLTAVVTVEDEPVKTWTKVTGVGLPVLTNPKRLICIDTIP